jgi:hypothetical protein
MDITKNEFMEFERVRKHDRLWYRKTTCYQFRRLGKAVYQLKREILKPFEKVFHKVINRLSTRKRMKSD